MHETPAHKAYVVPAYKLERFFNLSPDLLCIAGFDGYFKKINPAVPALLGYEMHELFSRPIQDFVHPEDREATAQARSSLKKNNPLLHFENRYITKTGEVVWLSWTSMPIEDEQLIFAIAKDITHKKKQEEERNALLVNMTRINSNLKRLTYTTSHDLRSPVNNLLSVFSIIDMSKINDPETVAFLEMLQLATQGLRKTINNYVEVLGKKEGLFTQIEEVDIGECLEHVLFSINVLVQHSHSRVHINFNAFNTVTFNKAYLESIFLNLLTNAIKYTRPGIAPIITIKTQLVDGVKQLVISDNGLGFDAGYVKDKMFGMNEKLHHHEDSTGIGLYLVNSHVTSLGGRVGVTSELNKGSTFTISFAGGS